jgi:regulator of sigma E protease
MMFFLFGITIFVHEWGHFFVARKCGLQVDAFAIGMGPALFKREINGVVYKICLFPIGGYVSLPQLDPDGMQKVQGDNARGDTPLADVSPWKKIAVAFAGPLCNVLFALLLAFVVTSSDQPEIPAQVGRVEIDSEAYASGLRAADKIVAVNGRDVESWYEVQVESLLSGDSQSVEMVVERGEYIRALQIKTNDPESAGPFIDGVTEAIPCVLGYIVPGSPAELAGIEPDDRVISFNHIPVTDWNHFTELVQETGEKSVQIIVMRDEIETLTLQVTPEYDATASRLLIGVNLGGSRSMPWSLTGSPIKQIKSDAASIFRLLKALTTPDEAKQAAGGLGGPVAIFTMIWLALKMGFIHALGLMRFININLAILNLLPIPVLDGGHILFSLYEGITRRKVAPKVIVTLVNAFAILLISAMIFLSVRDVDRFFNVERLFKQSESVETAPEE